MELYEFWQEHYQRIFASGESYLDYSNETVQLQGFAAVLDGSGGIRGKRCLDVGAGTGLFSRTLHALGAAHVCAVDFIPKAIEELRTSTPQVDSKLAKADEITPNMFQSPFDRVYVIEVLQYLDFDRITQNLWSLVAPGGRLVGVVPNADNAIVAQVIQRFESKFRAVPAAALMHKLNSLPDLSVARFKGLSFGNDQSVAAYESTTWNKQIASSENFNRIAFVAVKTPVTVHRPSLAS